VIGNHIRQELEPEQRNLVQDAAFVRNTCRQNIIKRRNTVAGYEQKLVLVDIVNVSDLTAGLQFEIWKIGANQDGI